jgi:hypothetical protein
MLAAGLAAAVASLMSWVSVVIAGGDRPAWAAALQVFGIALAIAFVPAAVGAAVLMPPESAVREPRPVGERAVASPARPLLFAALALIAILQAPAIAAWWSEDRALMQQLFGRSPSSLGLELIASASLLSLPALAATALLMFALTSVLSVVVRLELVARVFGACTALLSGLVIGLHFIVYAFTRAGDALRQLIAASSDAAAAAQVANWFGRHDAAADSVVWRLTWILAGYVVAFAVVEFIGARAATAGSRAPAATLPAAASLPSSPGTLPPRPVPASTAAMTPAARAFDDSSYSVRPRQAFVDMMAQRYSVYEIQTIPPRSRSRFTFEWKTGVLRRETDGQQILEVRDRESGGALPASGHIVIDSASGAELGTLAPNGAAWEIRDARTDAVARVVEEKTGPGFASYVARVAERAVCTFNWALGGASVASTGVDVEFHPGSDTHLDRALAIALAPIIEEKARRAAQRR